MIMKVIHESRCKSCHRFIEPQKFQLHYVMCSSKHLRKSRSSIIKDTKLQRCMFCMQHFLKQEFDFHVTHSCRHRLVPCIDCDDMFPLSLFTDHLEVCRGNIQRKQKNQQENEQSGSAFQSLWAGIGQLGNNIYYKGNEVAKYCKKMIQQNRAPVLQYIQSVKTTFSDALQDLFMSMAYEEKVEGMPRNQIRKLCEKNYIAKNSGQQEQNCTICFCQIQHEEVVKQLKCRHTFHPTCIDKWLRINRTCPLCKKDQMEQ